ncbi:MAG TPA: protoporphyrinogen oxidase, partial [Bacillota bacterium]|nr:protoporphyrinogen oxidase [Bacillota bacterium]
PETMRLQATFPRFLQMEKNYGSLVLAMLAARRKKPAAVPQPKTDSPKRTYFLSFKDGMGELAEALGTHLKKENTFLGEEVTSLERGVDESGRLQYTVHLSGKGTIQADAVLLAAPANNVAELVRPLDRKLAETLEQIPMGSSANISVAYRKQDLPFKIDTFGFVIPGVEKRKINAVTYTSMKWDFRTPDDDHVLVRTFVGGSKNQELALLDDHDMEHLVDREFHKVLGIKAKGIIFVGTSIISPSGSLCILPPE